MNLAGDVPVVNGDFLLTNFEFPAAYTSYMQITLATTSVLSDLRTSGSLSGELSVSDNGITSLHVAPKDLELHDNKGRLFLSHVNGDIHWAPGGGTKPADVEAFVVFRRRLWPVRRRGEPRVPPARHELRAHAPHQTTGVRWRARHRPVRDRQSRRASNMEVAFKGTVEPISMQQLAKAFGWPEFSGTLAASIPGVTLKDNVLDVPGQRRIAGVWRTHRRQQHPPAGSARPIPGILCRRARARSRSRTAHADLRGGQHHRQTRGRRARSRVVCAGRRRRSTRGSRHPRATNRGIASARRR